MVHAAMDYEGMIIRIEAPERCVGYGVYDPLNQKIGTVEKLFVNGTRTTSRNTSG